MDFLKKRSWVGVLWVVAACVAACGGTSVSPPPSDPDGGSTGATPDGGIAPSGAISAAAGTWTWVDFPKTQCDDGSPTGLGVNLGASSNVLVFFNGGGACWDATTCLLVNSAAHGPYGSAQFSADLQKVGTGSIVDRSDPANPFREWSFVFIPYCTGDLHAGDNVASYALGATPRSYFHKGRVNVAAYLERLIPTFASAQRVVVSGASAGGGGALFSYPSFRSAWPSAKMYLIDDSLPLFVGEGIPSARRNAWLGAWNLNALLGTLCGTGCESDFSKLHASLAQAYPSDRMALLSSQQDSTIRLFFGQDGPTFQTNLEQLRSNVLAPSATWKTFIVAGSTHTMLGNPSGYSADGVTLRTWLQRMLADDPSWVSAGP